MEKEVRNMSRFTRRVFLGGLGSFTALLFTRAASGQLVPFGMLKSKSTTKEVFPQTLASQPLGYACLGGTPI